MKMGGTFIMTTRYVLIPLSQLISSEVYSEDILLQQLKKFKCKQEQDIERFLQEKAILKEKQGVTRTYLFIDEATVTDDNIDVMGFISVAATALNIKHLTTKQRRKMLGNSVDNRDKLESCVAYLIGQLGRNDSYTHAELCGRDLLYEASSMFKRLQEVLAISDLITLECRTHMYEKFYERYGFTKMPLTTNEEDSSDEQEIIDTGLFTVTLRLSKLSLPVEGELKKVM
jgi:hypothetical protein